MPPYSSILATVFCFAAFVLLLIVSLSPIWGQISFLDVSYKSGGVLHYGVFGPTGGPQSIGYHFNSEGFTKNVESSVIYHLTKALILHPIAAALCLLSFLFSLLGIIFPRLKILATLGTLFIGPAFFLILPAFVFDMIIFNLVQNAYADQGAAAELGIANWLTIGAFAAALLGFGFSSRNVFGRLTVKSRREAMRY